jgi:hypothetical protein
MKKHLIPGTILYVLMLLANTPGEGSDNDFQKRVQQAIESLKSRGPVIREKFIDINLKEVRFPHKRHQELLQELNETCKVCHHKRKEGKDPRACRRCHAGRKVVSKGKYARAGQELSLSDIYHLLCGDCHKQMLENGYHRIDGSPGVIPTKCHHCHLKKQK